MIIQVARHDESATARTDDTLNDTIPFSGTQNRIGKTVNLLLKKEYLLVLHQNKKWILFTLYPDPLIYSYPVTCKDGQYTVVQGLAIDEFSRERMDATHRELLEERDGVKDLI